MKRPTGWGAGHRAAALDTIDKPTQALLLAARIFLFEIRLEYNPALRFPRDEYLGVKLYRWSQVAEEQVNPLAWRQIIRAENITIVRRRLLKGALLRLHRHAEEQVSMLLNGKLRFVVSGKEQIVHRGETLAIPPHVPHSVEALEDSVVTDLFSTGEPPPVAPDAGRV